MTATQPNTQDVSELALRVACMGQLREVERQYPDTGKAIREYLTLVVDERMRLWEAARELQQAQVVGEFDGAYMDIDEDGFPIYRWKQGHTVYAVMPTKDAISFLVTEGRRVAYVGKPITTPQSSAPVVGDALRAAAQAVVIGKVNPSAGRTRLVMLKDVQALESALTGRGSP